MWNGAFVINIPTPTFAMPFVADLDPNDGTPLFRMKLSVWSTNINQLFIYYLTMVILTLLTARMLVPCFFKTTDGGATWGGPTMVSLNNMDTILVLPQTGYVWSMLFEFDLFG